MNRIKKKIWEKSYNILMEKYGDLGIFIQIYFKHDTHTHTHNVRSIKH